MSRAAPRTRRTNRAATAESVAAPEPITDLDPADAGWERTLDLARAMMGASLHISRDVMQGLSALQRAQAASTRQTGERIAELAGQVERAPDWPALLAAQAALAGAQWTQSMQDLSTLCTRCMQIESSVIDRSRSDATQWSRRLAGDVEAADSVGAALDAPLALARETQAALAEMARWWSSAAYDSALPE